MEDLRTWVNIVQGSKFRAGNQLNLLLEPGTQIRRLYDAIASNRVCLDQDVNRQIPDLAGSDAGLSRVKNKLKDRLGDALFLLDFNIPESQDRPKAYVECLKKWTIANILFSKNIRHLGIQKLEQLLRQTRRFEFTELSIDILHALRLHSSITSGNEAEYQEYTEELKQLKDARNKEEEAETAYTGLVVAFLNNKSDKLEMAERARRAYAEIEPYLAEVHTCRLHLYGRLIHITIYDNQNDHARVIELCKDAIRFFDQKSYKSANLLQVFHYSLLVGYFNLREYSYCRQVAKQYLDIFQPGSYNWFKWNELWLLSELHAGHYDAAADIWLNVTSAPQYADLPASGSEFWKIVEIYLYFLSRCGRLKEKKIDKNLRVQKLLNEIYFVIRDKGGMNIPILIIQFLMPLVNLEYDQCLARQENMAKYRTRYIPKENAARSHYFFRMLEFIPKSAFDPELVARKAEPWVQKLASLPLETTRQNFEVEIIPYETLWEMVMEVLKKSVRVRYAS